MPRLSFKDVAAKAKSRTLSSSSREESDPLVTSTTSTQQLYTHDQRRKISSTNSIPRSVSTSSGLNDLPMVKIRPGMPIPSPPASPQVSAVLDIDFDLVPFQFYTRVNESWKVAFFQSFIILLVCLLCPFLIVMLLALGSTYYPTSERMKRTKSESQKMRLLYVALLTLTLAKDIIIIALILQFQYQTEASTYIVAYAPFVYIWFLILFVFPVTLFYFADVRYKFGFDSDVKKLLKSFAGYFVSAKTKKQQAQKFTDQDKYFEKKYELLSRVQSIAKEFFFVRKATSKHLFISATVLSFAVSIIHAFVPLLLQLIDFDERQELLASLNQTNSTSEDKKDMYVVMGLSTFNSFVASLIISPFFVYVIFWKIVLLNEWKRFNHNESQSDTTLVNGGPQGIAMWWKIRQTLKFFSCSQDCLSAFIGKTASLVSMVSVVCLSVAMVIYTISLKPKISLHNLVAIMIDSVLLYLALLIFGLLTILIEKEKRLSSDMIELKQLNVSYELGHLMNLEQEVIESEPGVKVKVRVMRGCLMLLKELTSTMENLERGSSSRIVLISFGVSTGMILPSLALAIRYLAVNIV